jgi:hypothetical protein
MPKKTKFDKENEERTAQERGPSPAMMALFQPSEQAAQRMEKLERRNMPAMYKPDDVPVDGVVSGEIMQIVESPVTTIKGKLLWLRNDSGVEFTFPCTGVIRNALAPGVKSEGGELMEALQKEVGKTFYARRLPNKQNSKYKKPMFMFDVYTGPKTGK